MGTQEFADVCSRDVGRAALRWLAANNPGEAHLFVSAISIGMLLHTIEQAEISVRNDWRRRWTEGRRAFAAKGRIIDVDAEIAAVWATHLRGADLSELDIVSGKEELMGEDARLVIATAIARGYSLVTKMTPALSQIQVSTTLKVIEP